MESTSFAEAAAEAGADRLEVCDRLDLDGLTPQVGDVASALGTVLLAGTNNHLYLAPEGHLVYRPEPVDQVYRPSIDVFFESVANHWRGEAIGVLLTGMGRDGARGLKQMRERGFHTIAQDQASSAVYGMPKAAVALDAATEVLPLKRIAARLVEHLG